MPVDGNRPGNSEERKQLQEETWHHSYQSSVPPQAAWRHPRTEQHLGDVPEAHGLQGVTVWHQKNPLKGQSVKYSAWRSWNVTVVKDKDRPRNVQIHLSLDLRKNTPGGTLLSGKFQCGLCVRNVSVINFLVLIIILRFQRRCCS